MWVVDKLVGFREPFEILLIADGDAIALHRNIIGLQPRKLPSRVRPSAFLSRVLRDNHRCAEPAGGYSIDVARFPRLEILRDDDNS